jgi:hypothetical protein
MEMRRTSLRRPSAAMVVACLALFVSLAGTSFATVSQIIPRNAIGPAQLKDNSVTSEKVRDFSLRLWDFKRGQLPRGPVGRTGPQGPAGPAGGIGPLILHESSVLVPANTTNSRYATRSIHVRCQPGERAIAGGTWWSNDADDAELITVYSRAIVESKRAVGWRARGGSDIPEDRTFNVQVLCVRG